MTKKIVSGFTLIEVLMVIFVMGILVVVGNNLFFSVLKGSSKAEIEKEAKQSGNYAIGVMERMIRNATSIVDCTSTRIIIKNKDGFVTEFTCASEDGTTKVASNSGRLTGKNLTLNQTLPQNSCSGSSLTFNCSLSTTPPVVSISFTLSEIGSSSRPEEKATVLFQTTVGLRNY